MLGLCRLPQSWFIESHRMSPRGGVVRGFDRKHRRKLPADSWAETGKAAEKGEVKNRVSTNQIRCKVSLRVPHPPKGQVPRIPAPSTQPCRRRSQTATRRAAFLVWGLAWTLVSLLSPARRVQATNVPRWPDRPPSSSVSMG